MTCSVVLYTSSCNDMKMNIGRSATPNSISGMMFCSSLRQRKEWDSVPQSLLGIHNEAQPKWREVALTTHDLAMLIPSRSANIPPGKAIFLLLSSSDLKLDTVRQRIERFSMLDGGGHAAIVFLLHEKEDKHDGMAEFVELQSTLMAMDIPIAIIPLPSTKSLPAILTTYHRQLLHRHPPSILKPSPQKQLDLLKSCSSKGKLKEHSVNVLGDLVHGFRELSEWAVTNEGVQAIGEYLQERQEVGNAVGFWKEEYIVD